DTIGPACDVHGLGVVLYELLTGRLPYDAPSAVDVLYKIVYEPPPRPRQFRPEIPAALEAVCLRALQKKASDRFRGMAEFAEALGAYYADAFWSAPEAERPPALKPERLRFEFVGYRQKPPAELPNRLYLDVGSDLRPGVIDHHQLRASFGSTSR